MSLLTKSGTDFFLVLKNDIVTVALCVCVPQDAGGTELPGSRVRDQRHAAEEWRETWRGQVSYCSLQEEMPHCE